MRISLSLLLMMTGFICLLHAQTKGTDKGREEDAGTFQKETIVIKMKTLDGEEQEKVMEVNIPDPAFLNAYLDSVLRAYGIQGDSGKVHMHRFPAFGQEHIFELEEIEALKEIEHLIEMGDHMKWIGVDDIETLRKMQWMEEDKPFLGIILDTDDDRGGGIRIMNIVEGSAAEDAGLLKGDVLTAIDDKKVERLRCLGEALSLHKVGDEVVLHYLRSGKADSARTTLKSRASSQYDLAKSFSFNTPPCCSGHEPCEHHANRQYKAFIHKQRPKLGVQVEDLDEEMIRDLKVEEGKGVLVSRVMDGTAAKEMGLRVNDVLLGVNGKTVTDVASLHEALSNFKAGDEVEISFLRYGVMKTVSGVLLEYGERSARDQMIFFQRED